MFTQYKISLKYSISISFSLWILWIIILLVRKSKRSFYDTKTLIMIFYDLGGITFFALRSFMWLVHNLVCNQPHLGVVNQVQSTKQQVKGPGSLFLLGPGYCPKKGPTHCYTNMRLKIAFIPISGKHIFASHTKTHNGNKRIYFIHVR